MKIKLIHYLIFLKYLVISSPLSIPLFFVWRYTSTNNFIFVLTFIVAIIIFFIILYFYFYLTQYIDDKINELK